MSGTTTAPDARPIRTERHDQGPANEWQVLAPAASVALAGGLLIACGPHDYPTLRTILDTCMALLAGLLALSLGDLGKYRDERLPKLFAVCFLATFALALLHVMAMIEWSEAVAPAAAVEKFLRSAIWPPAACLLPIGILCGLWLADRSAIPIPWFCLAMAVIGTAVFALFACLPAYVDAAPFGIYRPALLLAPLLWLLIGAACWRRRSSSRLMRPLASAALPLFAAGIAMLYSKRAADAPAMIAHLATVAGYVVLLVCLMRHSATNLQATIQLEKQFLCVRLDNERREAEALRLVALKVAEANLDLLAHDLAGARDRAEQGNQAKSRFLASMSHELRTPLNAVLGYAQLLRMEGGLNGTQGVRVEAMLAAGRHLLEMINRVLDFCEIEADKVVLLPVACDARAVADACLDMVRPIAAAKRLALSVAVEPGTRMELNADPRRLGQILVNLLGNAVKFTMAGCVQLLLRNSADGLALRFEVRDTGPGVPLAQKQRLFHDFDRLDTEASFNVEGAGIGLALSNRLAALMGGRLGHDDIPSGGSVFWLDLPVAALAARAPAPDRGVPVTEQTVAEQTLAARPLNVLAVDDVLMNLDLAGAFLRKAGHSVTCVDNGMAAVTAAACTDFDAILMDVRMPEMDGIEATRRIRALDGRRGKVPIVALTAQAFSYQVEACRDAGMDIHLTKPFDPDALLAAVMHAVAPAPAKRQLVRAEG